jgi:hypothetical protein
VLTILDKFPNKRKSTCIRSDLPNLAYHIYGSSLRNGISKASDKLNEFDGWDQSEGIRIEIVHLQPTFPFPSRAGSKRETDGGLVSLLP